VTERAVQVMLVEDDESLSRILARHLRSHGYDVDETGSAEEAVTILAQGVRPAVVVLDINLPGDNGWDLLRGPSLVAAGSPPVVIASALTISPRLLAEFDVAGFLPKPFALETLIATVEGLVGTGG
jgi:DNA-binding response OmpR family regulator